MDLGSIFIFLALLILVGMFLSRPFLDPEKKQDRQKDTGEEALHKSKLLAERDRILSAVEDLEFDHSLGKVADEDYQSQRKDLLNAGAIILQQLDDMTPKKSTAETQDISEGPERSQESLLDLETEEDDLEGLIRARRKDRKERAASFCHKCGNPLQKSDKFCPRCGTHIE